MVTDEIILAGLGLLFLVTIFMISKISGIGAQIYSPVNNQSDLHSRIDSMTAPAEVLTQVTRGLQSQVGLMNQSIKDISTQA